MVVQGDFKVQLVDAETNQPFKEFLKDGKHYMEVEPGTEYLISVERIGGRTNSTVRCSFEVDGVDLGYHLNQDLQTAERIGAWECKGGVSTTKALKFEKPVASSPSANGSQANSLCNSMMGTVKVGFYEAIPHGLRKLEQFASRTPSCEIGGSATGKAKKTAVRSQKGASKRSFRISNVCPEYKTGKALGTVTIQYCTTVGLIYAGVLQKPPLWEEARLAVRQQKRRQLDPAIANLVPKKIKRRALVKDGIKIRDAIACDVFDLTKVESDDEGSD